MKNMNTKIIRNIFPCLLAVVALTGCTGGKTSSDTSDSNPKTSDSGSSNSTASSSTGTASTFDAAQAIKPYTRDTTSGTRDGFMTKIGIEKAKSDDTLLKSTVETVTSNGDMIAKVAADEYGIGYFSYSSVDDATKQGVKVLNYAGVQATEDSILDGTYTLSRNFNYCTRTEADVNDATKWLIISAFVAFTKTTEGIEAIASEGGLVETSTDTKSWDDIKANYPGIDSDHSKITINFGGSTSCEKVAKALSAAFSAKAGHFVANHDHHGSGDAFKYTQQSGNDHKYDIAFASREFNASETLADSTYGKLCTDGIVIGVNKANPLTDITGEQALNIYSKDGTIHKWSDIK